MGMNQKPYWIIYSQHLNEKLHASKIKIHQLVSRKSRYN
ncbi:hypothetical protein AM1_C0137 (plasmid) [Acaryochloris marina MBIC11017]|uniref:Uncharacterized protein n=1 Tax=Acaryochloris marina (strain MBIC 11017) TaxID=329726 RepID=A8ZMN3_ACAM1|nr:hypothetical protein AM1_C0137 [Acaryochloris marina MBIC11017]